MENKIYFSPSNGSFYMTDWHGDNIPEDKVEVSAEEHMALVEARNAGKVIVLNEQGRPVAVDPPAPPIEAVQDGIWVAIKAERDRRTQEGGYQVGDHWFHSDTLSRIQQLGLVLLGENMPQGVQWKTLTGEFVPMTPQLAQQVFAAAAASDIAVFAAAEAHKAAMLASADPAAYDFSAGWPPVFQPA